jgi:hypothetical protein
VFAAVLMGRSPLSLSVDAGLPEVQSAEADAGAPGFGSFNSCKVQDEAGGRGHVMTLDKRAGKPGSHFALCTALAALLPGRVSEGEPAAGSSNWKWVSPEGPAGVCKL